MRREISTELKELRLHGMAQAWDELTTHEGKPNDVGIQTSRWLIEHLLQAEHEQRAFASVRHQMKAAPVAQYSIGADTPTIATLWRRETSPTGSGTAPWLRRRVSRPGRASAKPPRRDKKHGSQRSRSEGAQGGNPLRTSSFAPFPLAQ